ncbi:regulatory helix-turn-helix protein, lysR family [Burkholderia sp. OK233]|nr:regulatory helix-turn-helix protein, lysR family [Burkholderia sp. OK233]
MNFRHRQYLILLGEELNFSRAVERLHVAQPALSRQISLPEQGLGVRLFDGSGRPLRLTDAGLYFCVEARQILSSYERATLGTREIGIGKRGWLGIGFTRTAMHSVFPPAVKTFHRAYPDVEFKGFVNLPRAGRHDDQCDDWSESDQRILGDLGKFAPGDEPGKELFAIE